MSGLQPRDNPRQHLGRSGRPFKFAEPSRAITLTLPESTLRDLEQVDPDRGRAIVKLAKDASWDVHEGTLVEIVEIGDNTGLLILRPTGSLTRISFLQLVEVAPGRQLLALSPGHDFYSLEIALNDLLDDIPKEDSQDREVVTQLLRHIKNCRKSERVSMAQILLVHLEKTGR